MILENELIQLKNDVVEMWVMVNNQLQKSEKAFISFDKNLVDDIQAVEKRVDSFELKLDKDCESIFSIYTPVASDLRFVLSVLKINYNLERIGDYSYGIAKLINDLEKEPNKELLKNTRVVEMYDMCHTILTNALDSFVEGNNDHIRSIYNCDKELDNINRDSINIIIDYIKNNLEDIDNALAILSIIKKLERVGDHVQNIGEEIVFYHNAKVLKHLKMSKIDKILE